MKPLEDKEQTYKYNLKNTFMERLKTRMKECGFNQQLLTTKMNEEYSKRVGQKDLNKSYKSSIEKWCSVNKDNPATFNIPDTNNMLMLSNVLDCDIEYLIGEQEKPRKDIHSFSEKCGLSYDALMNLKKNKLLEYLLENNSDEFYKYLDKYVIASKQDISYRLIKYIPGHREPIKEFVKDISDYTPETYHKNLVKMKKWLEEWGNEEFLMREAIKAHIEYLNSDDARAFDIYANEVSKEGE